ncbi:hypothetical protein [Parahaliea mediterranea]|uniref:hypothetical protein n=1 Tax=Parahaliea mediterranea TaxID=651086 RepID=UPI000E2F789C|nr:hypothetical protein [Parahaliea mediterranea]
MQYTHTSLPLPRFARVCTLVLGVAGALFGQSAMGQCTVAGTVATCTGAPGSVSYDAQAPEIVDTLVLNSVTDTANFGLFNNAVAESHDLAIQFNSGTITGSSFIFHIRNRGYGTTDAFVNGTLQGGGVRHQTNLADSTAPHSIVVGATGVVNSNATALWLRDVSVGPSTVDVSGNLTAGVSRAVHLSNNNTADTTLTTINLRSGASARGDNQALYLGNEGSGDSVINVDGTVMGGTEYPSNDPFKPWATGVLLDATSGAAILNIGPTGVVESLNDLAIVDMRSRATAGGGVTTINNQGRIVGWLLLGDGDDTYGNADVLNNSGTLLLRDYADDDLDGTRDTQSDPQVDFGGGDDRFVNTGNLVLASLDIAPSPGIESASIVALEAFAAGGVISLLDTDGGGAAPVAGDNLQISGTFTTEGGSLRLDVVAGDGSSASDLLTLEDVAQGSGPVDISITNAGGAGALTTGLGIPVVQVSGSSPPGAFTMTPFTVNGFEYSLVQADGQNWYLQSRQAPVEPEEPETESGTLAKPVPVMPLPLMALLAALMAGLASRSTAARSARSRQAK